MQPSAEAAAIRSMIKGNRFFPLLLCFAVLAIAAVLFFTAKYNLWIWLILLLCPLVHIFMMRGHSHGQHEHASQNRLYECPECGFKYDQKEWAKMCEAWCKEHHTCNVEIIKHAKVDK